MTNQSPLDTLDATHDLAGESRAGVINRRSLLLGLGIWSLNQLLSGCSGKANTRVNVHMLRGSIPAQLVNEFRKSAGSVDLSVTPVPKLETLFSALQTWKQLGAKANPDASWLSHVPLIGKGEQGIPDWVTLGDYWLSTAIAQGLVQPIPVNQLSAWGAIAQNPALKALITRDNRGIPSPNGAVWGVPYRVGSTLIAYRRDLLKQQGIPEPTNWRDLWNPALRGKISLVEQPREVIGLTLKMLGKSYNTANLSDAPNLMSELRALQRQVKFYSSDAYLQPLLLGDTWVAVGWSADILPTMQRSPQISGVVPRSGTALWADLWVRPAGIPAQFAKGVADWSTFGWQPDMATKLTELSWATAPLWLGVAKDRLPAALQALNAARVLDPAIVQASEFLSPLPIAAMAQYQTAWREMRNS